MFHVKLDRSVKRGHRSGEFGIEVLYPGLPLDGDDSGIGAIGRIDQAKIEPGGFIPMHPHRDDEILTYVRQGTMLHRDTAGHQEIVTNQRLMLMNAGHTFQHEELMLGEENIEALQIFMRPRSPGLEPKVQFHDFGEPLSVNRWRMIAGPDGEAPLEFRTSAWVHDMRLKEAQLSSLPVEPVEGAARLLYVFAGRVVLDGVELVSGESLLLDERTLQISAQQNTDLLLFTTDMRAPVFAGGMFSGNVR
ncbi:pimeloyl-CoA dehydrogenase [Rhizobium altiplani]|uniref:Pimeloyl-CoA dehydrogenase n=1 Tax=Rhizobium altiplani TaxID=1864509 RepID=A0A109J3T0_9HYPH|nr:pirin family protein [Rhizobium altiplani]KWV41815.1 pimeloyl-CoA dehydrogenase [Rhizobium altiplani]